MRATAREHLVGRRHVAVLVAERLGHAGARRGDRRVAVVREPTGARRIPRVHEQQRRARHVEPAQLLGLGCQGGRAHDAAAVRRGRSSRSSRTSRLPTTSRPASTTSGILKLPVWSSAIPVNAGPTKPPEVADGGDQRDAGRRGRAAQEGGGQRPEERKRREDAHGRQGNANGEQERRLRVGGDHRTGRAHQRRRHQAAAAPRHDHHRDRGEAVRDGGQHAHLEVGEAGPVLHEVGHEEREPEAPPPGG